MNDIRERLSKDRGFLKEIEMAIPGFRGYRKREDLRIADSLLRKYLEQQLENIMKEFWRIRRQLTKKMELESLEEIGTLINTFQTTINQVSNAEQGYSGVSPDYRVEEDKLSRLYEWDLSLINNINSISNQVSQLDKSISESDQKIVMETMNQILTKIQDFNLRFKERILKIDNIFKQ